MGRGLQDEGEISARSGFGSGNGLRFGLREDCIGDLLAGNVVLQDEIFVGNLSEILESDRGGTGAGAVDYDFVRGGT